MSCEISEGSKVEDHSDSESEPHDLETCEIFPCVECEEAIIARGDFDNVAIVDTSHVPFVVIKSFSEIFGNKMQLADGDDDSDQSSCVTVEEVRSESPSTNDEEKGDTKMEDESDAQSRN